MGKIPKNHFWMLLSILNPYLSSELLRNLWFHHDKIGGVWLSATVRPYEQHRVASYRLGSIWFYLLQVATAPHDWFGVWGGKGSRRKHFSAQEEWREYLQWIPRSEPLLAKTQKHCFLHNHSTKSFGPKGGLAALLNAQKVRQTQ